MFSSHGVVFRKSSVFAGAYPDGLRDILGLRGTPHAKKPKVKREMHTDSRHVTVPKKSCFAVWRLRYSDDQTTAAKKTSHGKTRCQPT